MAAVQMNVRIDEAVKAEGDAALAEAGYSPSEAARLVWGFAARNRRNPRKVREMVDALRDPAKLAAEAHERDLERAEVDEWLRRGPDAVGAYCEMFGIDLSSHVPMTPEEQDEAIADMLEEDMQRIRLGMGWDEYEIAKARGRL